MLSICCCSVGGKHTGELKGRQHASEYIAPLHNLSPLDNIDVLVLVGNPLQIDQQQQQLSSESPRGFGVCGRANTRVVFTLDGEATC